MTAVFNAGGKVINVVLIDPSTGQPYAPVGVTPVSGTKYGEGPAILMVLIDPATGLPYKMS